MRERIDEITEAVQALLKMSANYDRGQIVPWHKIEQISGPRNENRGRHVIQKWRKRLQREREIVTLCADSVGVRLLTHSETAREIPALRQRKAYRQVRKALREVATVNSAQLTDHEQRLLAAQRVNMANTRRELFRSRKQATMQATETTPRRKIPA